MNDAKDLLKRISESSLSKEPFSFELDGVRYSTFNKALRIVLENMGDFTGKKRIYSTHEVYTMVGISKNTLIRWGEIYPQLEIGRDWRGWREYTAENIQILRKIKNGEIKK